MDTTIEEAVNAAPAVGKEVVIGAVAAMLIGSGVFVYRRLRKVATTDPFGNPIVPDEK